MLRFNFELVPWECLFYCSEEVILKQFFWPGSQPSQHLWNLPKNKQWVYRITWIVKGNVGEARRRLIYMRITCNNRKTISCRAWIIDTEPASVLTAALGRFPSLGPLQRWKGLRGHNYHLHFWNHDGHRLLFSHPRFGTTVSPSSICIVKRKRTRFIEAHWIYITALYMGGFICRHHPPTR